MRQLVTADLHFSDNPRDAYRLQFLKTLHNIACKHKVDEILILGDLCQEKDNHPARLVNTIVNGFAAIAKSGISIVILRGNHDGMTPDNPFFQFMRHIERIQWISKPTVRHGDLFLPHTLDHEHDWHDALIIIQAHHGNADLIFAHNTFTGTRSANGHKLSGIPTTIFPKGAVIISGDVHEPQDVGPVRYVGAPYRVDHGDEYEPRVLLIDDEGIRSIRVAGPQKRLIGCRWPTKPSEFKPPFSRPFSDAAFAKCKASDILKIRVTIEMAQREQWAEIRDAIRAWGDQKKLVIHTVQPIVEFTPGKKNAAAQYAPKTDEDLIREYARRRGLDKPTLETGLDISKGEKHNERE